MDNNHSRWPRCKTNLLGLFFGQGFASSKSGLQGHVLNLFVLPAGGVALFLGLKFGSPPLMNIPGKKCLNCSSRLSDIPVKKLSNQVIIVRVLFYTLMIIAKKI